MSEKSDHGDHTYIDCYGNMKSNIGIHRNGKGVYQPNYVGSSAEAETDILLHRVQISPRLNG